jgi:hypothetical protein
MARPSVRGLIVDAWSAILGAKRHEFPPAHTLDVRRAQPPANELVAPVKERGPAPHSAVSESVSPSRVAPLLPCGEWVSRHRVTPHASHTTHCFARGLPLWPLICEAVGSRVRDEESCFVIEIGGLDGHARALRKLSQGDELASERGMNASTRFEGLGNAHNLELVVAATRGLVRR